MSTSTRTAKKAELENKIRALCNGTPDDELPAAIVQLVIKSFYDPDYQVGYVFGLEDVQSNCPGLTEDQGLALLTFINEDFDANAGITNEIIQDTADKLFGR
ncbi:hypothetical protein IQ268_16940 [Oculatella sp. LEGE 06141]|uniref:hypothetical protein n=1 Tax=Oculatella sp. LEGE 06141 TaxID=1828648 RepID=UPI00187E7A56|nr:hypothetical protein [Oculatella sp. LEGE 06141]MBE9180252.1 hypothetical protein [Oculatella sp. LEGE 06141]